MQYIAIQITYVRICNAMLKNYTLNSYTKIDNNNIKLEIVKVYAEIYNAMQLKLYIQ